MRRPPSQTRILRSLYIVLRVLNGGGKKEAKWGFALSKVVYYIGVALCLAMILIGAFTGWIMFKPNKSQEVSQNAEDRNANGKHGNLELCLGDEFPKWDPNDDAFHLDLCTQEKECFQCSKRMTEDFQMRYRRVCDLCRLSGKITQTHLEPLTTWYMCKVCDWQDAVDICSRCHTRAISKKASLKAALTKFETQILSNSDMSKYTIEVKNNARCKFTMYKKYRCRPVLMNRAGKFRVLGWIVEAQGEDGVWHGKSAKADLDGRRRGIEQTVAKSGNVGFGDFILGKNEHTD